MRFNCSLYRYDAEAEEPDMEDVIAASAGADPAAREDAKICATLFKGLVFFIQREAGLALFTTLFCSLHIN